MNIFADFQARIANLLEKRMAAGELPRDLDLGRFVVEPGYRSAGRRDLWARWARQPDGRGRICLLWGGGEQVGDVGAGEVDAIGGGLARDVDRSPPYIVTARYTVGPAIHDPSFRTIGATS